MLCKTPRIWFLIVRKTYPWTTLAIIGWRLIEPNGLKKNREKVRFLMAYCKIDFASILSLMNDMIF